MIDKIFEYYYTMDMHPVRLAPLSREELRKGMPEKAVDEYLTLVGKLYSAFALDVNGQKVPLPLPLDVQNQRCAEQTELYHAILKLLLTHNSISIDTFFELHKKMSVYFGYEEVPNNSGRYVGDSLDDFRLAFELNIVENSENINVDTAYLNDRYEHSICIRPGTPDRWINNHNLRIVRFEEPLSNDMHIVELSYWEVRHLLKRIEEDIKANIDEQKRLDDAILHPNRGNICGISFEKWSYAKPTNDAEWYTMKRALQFECDILESLQFEIQGIFECMKEPDETVGNGAVLYIYKSNISCHQKHHPIVPATAILFDEFGREIQLDVEFCPACNRYLLNYVSFLRYREKHNVLIGKLKMITSTGTHGEIELAPESPLKLCGYDVSQANGLSAAARQYILAKIIHDGVMKKTEVIRYLEQFIPFNGAKSCNALAAKKWSEDLDFVHKYNMEIQPKTYIGEIMRY